jgi:hypothetical protein
MFRYKAGEDPGIFQGGCSMPLSSAFKGGRVHYWLFSKGESTFKMCLFTLSPVLTGGKKGPLLLYYFGEYFENHEYRVDHDPCSKLNFF